MFKLKVKLLFFLIFIVVIVFSGNVRAGENNSDVLKVSDDDKLGSGYYYDSQNDVVYTDKTIDAKDLSAYYGSHKKFMVKVFNDDGTPAGDVDVHFFIKGKNAIDYNIKLSNSKGIVSFPIKYPSGKYDVVSAVYCYDDNGKKTDDFWFTKNKIKIKSTISAFLLSKSIKDKNKKFSIKFLDCDGKMLKHKKIKLKVKGKVYKIKTNSKGIAKFKINSLKIGKHKITAINVVTGEKRSVNVKIKK